MTPAVVLGATGQVGLFAVSRLLEAGCAVMAVTRNPANETDSGIPGLRRYNLGQLAEHLRGRGDEVGPCALLSCGPVVLARELLEAETGARTGAWERVVVIGTTSLLSKQDSADSGERRTIEEIQAHLDAIRRQCAANETALATLHPTLIYGCGMDENLSRVYRWIKQRGFAPVATRSSGLRQPLHVADLARSATNAVLAESAPVLDTAVCGGTTLPYREMVEALFDAAGRKPRFLPLPAALFAAAVAVSAAVPAARGINPEMFRRQAVDLVFDDSPARRAVGHAPRTYRPTDADFRLPEPIQRIRAALA